MILVTRTEWGARSPKRFISKPMTRVTTEHWNGPVIKVNGQLTWDHSKCASLVRGIQNFHMDGHGWSDVAYNFLVCPHGYIFEGRGLNVVNAANGVTEANRSSHTICSLAGEGNPFPDQEKFAIKECVEYIAKNTGAPNRCIGHRDHHSTACPGEVRYVWVHEGMPIGIVVTPTPPTPPSNPPQNNGQNARIRYLQTLVGSDSDGIWGPKTEAAINRNLIGWKKNLSGNNNRRLVTFLQQQGNRKFGGGFVEDGIVGPNTNHLITVLLGQNDSIAGPKAWRIVIS